jgi:hypothetical protein
VRSTAAPYTESRLARLVRNKRVGFPVVEHLDCNLVNNDLPFSCTHLYGREVTQSVDVLTFSRIGPSLRQKLLKRLKIRVKEGGHSK